MVLNLHYRTAVYLVPMSALIGQKPTVLYTGRPIEFYLFVVSSLFHESNRYIDYRFTPVYRLTGGE